MSNAEFSAAVSMSSALVEVTVRDPRQDSLETFGQLAPHQQEQLARDAWRVGLRALMNAYRQADEAKLADVGAALVEDLGGQLRAHAEVQEKALTTALGRYFDPESGELGARLKHFMGDGGTLMQLLQQQLGPRNSMLGETLAKHVGEQSPLFKRLSPTDSEGLVAVLGERMRAVLQEEHGAFQKALDPYQDGAIGKFIAKLREELKRAEDDQAQQLKVALAALDTTKEDSLLNQLRRDTQQARTELMQAINPAREGSPLAIIKSSLSDLLAAYAKSTKEQLEDAQKQNAEFQRDVRDAVQRLETRRREELRSNRGGEVFEDAVAEFIQGQLGGYGYVVETTGNVVGLRPSCKVGDVVVHFPADSAFAGSRVVIEAKRDKSYTVTKALDELATARKNRDAVAGVFVLARSSAGPGFQTFARYGHDVVVVWDDESPASDPYLQAALMVGLALATRTKCGADEGDLQALQGIEQRLVQELNRLGKIRASAEAIRKQAETIASEVNTGEKKVTKILDDAKKTLLALNVELRDDQAERSSPIALTFGGEEMKADNDVQMAVGD